MPGGAAVEVDGFRQLNRQLRQAGADMADMKDLNTQVGGIILPVARGRAPVSPEPGKHLFQTVRASATKTQAVVRAGNNTTVRYANPIHWGWYRRHIKPNPWVSQAAQSTEPTWFGVYVRGIDRILDKIKGKGGAA